MRRVRHAQGECVALGLGRGEGLLGVLQLLLDALQLLELLGRRLALELRARHAARRRAARARASARRPRAAVERVGRALAGERGPDASGFARAALRSIIAPESRDGLDHGCDALVLRPGAGPSAIARSRGCAALDRDAEAGPAEQLDVVLAVAERDDLSEVEPEPLRDEREPRSLRHAGLPSSSR